MSKLPIVILAAGQSSRMRGRDKLMEEVEGMPLVRRQAEIARAATNGPVIVALPVPPHPRHAALAGLDVTRLAVPDAAEGMSASLRAGITALPGDTPAALLLLADLPALEAEDLRTMLDAVKLPDETLAWQAVTEDGKPGHPVVVAADLFPALARLSGDTGARDVIRAAGSRVQQVPLPGQRARLDLDTPQDWAAWRVRNDVRRPRG